MNKIKSLLSIFGSTVSCVTLLCLPALADQCSYITKEQALTAVSRLNLNDTIYFLCEPCGETIPRSAVIKSLSATTVNYQDYWQVQVNDQGIDLAYVFVNSSIDNNLINLAAVSNCPARSVSTVLSE